MDEQETDNNDTAANAKDDGQADEANPDGPVPSLLVELVPGQKKLPLDLRRVHTCVICDSKFTRKGSLSRHMLTHSAEKPFKCLECGKQFRQKGNLTLHEFTHTGARPYQCSVCDQAFITKTKMQIHESIHCNDKPWRCQECGKGFKRDADLRKHLLIHNGEKTFSCDLCGKSFLLNSQLKAHKVRHNGEEPFKCAECGKVFLLNGDLKAHECVPLPIVMKLQRPKRKRKNEESGYEVVAKSPPLSPKMDRLSDKIKKLSHDMEEISQGLKESNNEKFEIKDGRVMPDEEVKLETVAMATSDESMAMETLPSTDTAQVVKCTLAMAAEAVSMATGAQIPVDSLDEESGLLEIGESCNNQNEEVDSIDLDEDKDSLLTSDDKTDDDKKVECNICGRQFVHELTLEKHMLIHTKEKLHKCDICGEAFAHGYSLKEHKMNHSLVADGKPYKCQYCDMVFKHASYLKRHESIHTGERPWTCETCGKCFRTKWHLTSHNKSHSGDRPHQCELCGRAFGHRCDLKQHMLVHTGERPHVCEQCGQSFKSSSHYWQHMRRHSGEKRHKCTYEDCDKAYTTPYELQRHLQFHTGEKPWICGVCGKAYIDKAVMLRHERGHTGAKDYRCKICDEAFDMKSLLNEHMSVHAANGDVPKRKKKKKKNKENKCYLCGEVFETEELLEEHKVFHTVLPYNGPEKTFKCKHCDDRFAEEGGLRLHEEIHKGLIATSKPGRPTGTTSQHNTVHEFECWFCHELFLEESLCKSHELKHTSGELGLVTNHNVNQSHKECSTPVFPEGQLKYISAPVVACIKQECEQISPNLDINKQIPPLSSQGNIEQNSSPVLKQNIDYQKVTQSMIQCRKQVEGIPSSVLPQVEDVKYEDA
jgi:KRAB domain-containing zinc finger protein